FPFIGGSCSKSTALGLGVLIGILQRRQRTGFCKRIEPDITELEACSRPDCQVSMSPIIAGRDKDVNVSPIGATVGSALERCPPGVITAWTSTDSRVQIETIGK